MGAMCVIRAGQNVLRPKGFIRVAGPPGARKWIDRRGKRVPFRNFYPYILTKTNRVPAFARIRFVVVAEGGMA